MAPLLAMSFAGVTSLLLTLIAGVILCCSEFDYIWFSTLPFSCVMTGEVVFGLACVGIWISDVIRATENVSYTFEGAGSFNLSSLIAIVVISGALLPLVVFEDKGTAIFICYFQVVFAMAAACVVYCRFDKRRRS